MNDKIKELYEQSFDTKVDTLYLAFGINQVSGDFENKSFNPEKFAKLIIQDCMKLKNELSDNLEIQYEERSSEFFDGYEKALNDYMNAVSKMRSE